MTSVKEGGTTTANVFSGIKKDEKIKSLIEENKSLINKIKELESKISEAEKKSEEKNK